MKQLLKMLIEMTRNAVSSWYPRLTKPETLGLGLASRILVVCLPVYVNDLLTLEILKVQSRDQGAHFTWKPAAMQNHRS